MNNEILCIRLESSRELFFKLIIEEGEQQTLINNKEYYIVKHLKTDQITYVKKGYGLTVLNGIEYQLKKGTVVFIPKNTSHYFKAVSNTLELVHYHTPRENIENDIVVIYGEKE